MQCCKITGGRRGKVGRDHAAVVKVTTDSFQISWYPKMGMLIFQTWFPLVLRLRQTWDRGGRN